VTLRRAAVFLNMGSGAFDLKGPEPDACAPLKKNLGGLLDAPRVSRFPDSHSSLSAW
jgi:hypothetical protein